MVDDIKTVRSPRTKDRPYFSMSRETAQDERLSWEARGVLAYLLSKPDDWQVQVKDLQQHCGRDKVRNILAELQEFQYISVHQLHDKNGKFTRNIYQVHETPFTEKPSTVEPSTANPTLTYNREEQIIDTHSPALKSAEPTPQKKVRPPHKNASWHDALLLCFKLTPDTVTKSADRTYWTAASDFAGINFPVERIPEFYRWCKAQEWPSFTVMAMAKYAGEWLTKHQPRPIAPINPSQDLSIQQPIIPMFIKRQMERNHE